MNYKNPSPSQRESELARLRAQYDEFSTAGLRLDMSRGKPEAGQLDLSEGLLTSVATSAQAVVGGADLRNYGVLEGIPAARKLFSDVTGISPERIIIGGASSLNLMFDAVARAMIFGVGGHEPWLLQKQKSGIKFIAPVPGYDRHFAICEKFGIEMLNVDMLSDGPDMDAVETLVAADPTIKGIWCVPKYSNPGGVVYSDDVVRCFAALKPAASDFRIFWDDAYIVHDLYGHVRQLNLLDECEKVGNSDLAYVFTSFAKISFAGGGISMIAASPRNIAEIKSIMTVQTICFDKVNQQRHVNFFPTVADVYAHMERHAAILRPKFEAVLTILKRELCGVGAEWTSPQGGYFISLNLPDGTAARTYALAKAVGVTLTPAGASFPYGRDPRDRNLRIAPSYPPLPELIKAAEVLCVCAKIACLEKR